MVVSLPVQARSRFFPAQSGTCHTPAAGVKHPNGSPGSRVGRSSQVSDGQFIKISPLAFDGVYLIKPAAYPDDRGPRARPEFRARHLHYPGRPGKPAPEALAITGVAEGGRG
jgi:hypothetical protein